MPYQTKDDLQAIASRYGVELDLTKRHAELVAEVDALKASDGAPEPEPEPEPEPTRVMFRNIVSGQLVPYNKIFEGNPDLEKIEVPAQG